MSCGKYTLKDTCGPKKYAICTYFQGELPEWSDLDEDCVTLEETTQELYDHITEMGEPVPATDLIEPGCIIVDTIDKKTQKDINNLFQEKICQLLDGGNNSGPAGVFCLNLDYHNLDDNCDTPGNWCQFAQFVLDKLNELNNKIQP